jgi:SAM-dependent methyltransferase
VTFQYTANYDSSALRGNEETQRPWDLINEIIACGGKEKNLLDIGCGTASKLIPLSQHFAEITGIDISKDMIHAASHTIKKHATNNINLLHCDSNNLPFNDKTFDVVTCILSRWNIREIARILKPKGLVIVEHIGCEDKKEFKILFGKDQDGWRGQLLNDERDTYLNHFHEMFSNFFEFVTLKNGFWNTYYTEQGILELLKFTPTIRNFDQSSDNITLKYAYDFFKNPRGILLTQNRILIRAKNPRIF